MYIRATVAAVGLLLASGTHAQAVQPQPAGPPRELSPRAVCAAPAFAAPVSSVERLQTVMARVAMQRDVSAVLTSAGLASLAPEISQILSNSLVTEAPQPVGTHIEWISRRAPRPTTDGPFRWAGPGPLPAFGFVVDDLSSTYTFIVVKPCAALALVKREPSLEAARRADAARAAEAARLADEAVQARLQAAERERAELKARRDEDMRRATEQAAAEKAIIDDETERALADQRQQERELVAQALSADRTAAASDAPRQLGVILSPFVGAARHRGRAEAASWTAIAGGKVGLDVSLGRRWTLLPALGVDTRLDASNYTRLEFETEVRLALGAQVAVGAGMVVADATRSDRARIGWLGTIGTPIGSPARRRPVRVFLEGQRLFERRGVQDGAYRLVAGLELRVR